MIISFFFKATHRKCHFVQVDSKKELTFRSNKPLNRDNFVHVYSTNRKSNLKLHEIKELERENMCENRNGSIELSGLIKRTVGCQTIYREQSAQTKPRILDFQFNYGIDQPTTAILNRNADLKRSEIIKHLSTDWENSEDSKHILETIEWEKWLTNENETGTDQLLRRNLVEVMLCSRMNQYSLSSERMIDRVIKRQANANGKRTEKIM